MECVRALREKEKQTISRQPTPHVIATPLRKHLSLFLTERRSRKRLYVIKKALYDSHSMAGQCHTYLENSDHVRFQQFFVYFSTNVCISIASLLMEYLS